MPCVHHQVTNTRDNMVNHTDTNQPYEKFDYSTGEKMSYRIEAFRTTQGFLKEKQ